MAVRGRNRITFVAAAAAFGSLLVAGPSSGQIFEDPSTTTTTTTTAAPPTTLLAGSTTTTSPPPPTTAAPGSPAPEGGAPPPPGGEAPADGDGGPPPASGSRAVPPDAQRIIDSVARTGPSSSADLLAAVEELVGLGLSREEAIRVGFGRFPVAGLARYSHDWLYPRYGPGFRFHLGTDVFAAYGTPLRAPVDGIVRSGSGSLGGLYVKIFMDDGTYFYFAHMSGLVEGFTEGMRVETGDIVGYVGDSGNAKGTSPHLHIGIHPKGGDPTDPKPILDQFLADALAQLPDTLARVRASRGGSPAAPAPAEVAPALPEVSEATPFRRRAVRDVPTAVLYQTTANPSAGGVSVARAEAERLAAGIDWDAWADRADTRDLARRTEEALSAALGTLVR